MKSVKGTTLFLMLHEVITQVLFIIFLKANNFTYTLCVKREKVKWFINLDELIIEYSRYFIIKDQNLTFICDFYKIKNTI